MPEIILPANTFHVHQRARQPFFVIFQTTLVNTQKNSQYTFTQSLQA
jgi:hypothetical protein